MFKIKDIKSDGVDWQSGDLNNGKLVMDPIGKPLYKKWFFVEGVRGPEGHL